MNRMTKELIPDAISHDVVEALQTLLEGARSGQITGIGFVAVLRRQRFIANVAGTCTRNVTHARGMLSALSDQLGDVVRERDPEDTR